MVRIIAIILSIITVDFFFFSTAFTFTGPINTKMILGVFGAMFWIVDSISSNESKISKGVFFSTLAALGVSLATYASMTINATEDSTYLDYVISMWVWLSAGYAACKIVNWLNGGISVKTISHYIIIVTFIQGLIAVAGSTNKTVNLFIKQFIRGTEWLDSVNRIYGFGDTACVDTGGIRFAIALVLISYLLRKFTTNVKWYYTPLYLFAFGFIFVSGNMIARTTMVGAIVGLGYLLATSGVFKTSNSGNKGNVRKWLLPILAIIIPATSYFYQIDKNFRYNTRFAFEGFFSLVEKGKWEVASNEKLKSMYVYPDNFHTWIIGDGYIVNPYDDPYYQGVFYEGYYKNTDVGYLRFIFYFGLIGLSLFIVFILTAARCCMNVLPRDKILIFLFLLMNFAVWMKVATDLFFIMGLYMSLGDIMLKEQKKIPSGALRTEDIVVE